MPDRDDAVRTLEKWVENEGLRKHMYAVEAAVRHYARLRGADEDVWGLAASRSAGPRRTQIGRAHV